MNKKGIISGGIVAVLAILSVFLFARPVVLGNMNQNFTEPTTSNSNISFEGEENNKIKFSFRSNVESGELNIILFDSDGNIVYELDRAKALETYFTFDKTEYRYMKQSDFCGEWMR